MEEELQKLTVVKLREKLSEKGLDTRGVKAVLVKRLLEALHNEEGTSEPIEDVTRDDSALPRDDSALPRDDSALPRDDSDLRRDDSDLPRDDNDLPRDDNDLPRDDSDSPRDEAPRQDDANGKQPGAETAEPDSESDSQKPANAPLHEQVEPMEGTEDIVESRKRPARPGEDCESKRSKPSSTDEAIPTEAHSDRSETGDKMYLSLIGDESNEKDGGRSPSEPTLTEQQEDSLLGEEPVEVLKAEDHPPEPSDRDPEQSALDSDNEHEFKHDSSQGTLPLVESGTANDAQSSGQAEKIIPNAQSRSPPRDAELENELSETKDSEATLHSTAVDSTKECNSNDSGSHTEKSAESQNLLEEDSERKKEWIHKQLTNISLDEYTSDLNCRIDAESMSVTPFSESHFALMFAGVKCTHGFHKGRIRFDVKVLELLEVDVGDEKHALRVGFCRRLNQQSVRLGEDKYSWALCSNGKKASEGNFETFVELPDLKVGDVFSSLLDLDRCPAELKFAHNGKELGVAFELATEGPVSTNLEEADKPPPSDETAEQEKLTKDEDQEESAVAPAEETKKVALYPAVMTRNVKVEVDFGQVEVPAPLETGGTEFVFPREAEESGRVKDDIAPYTKRECELIMMIGLPSSGKSTWVQEQIQKHPEKHYNVLGNANVLRQMTIEGQPQTKLFEAGLDELTKRAMNCLTKLVESAAKQRRNIILDETNVNGSVQANKWRLFDGFKRRAVVVVTTTEKLKERHAKRPAEEILLSDRTVTEMKACFEIPSGSQFRGCVTFAELSRDDAEKVVERYNEEASKELGIEPRQRRRRQSHSDHHRSGSGGRGFHRGSSGSFNRSNYGDFRPRGSGRGNFHPGSSWGPMRGGGPNAPPSRWGRGGMPPMNFQPQPPRGGPPNAGRSAGGQYGRNGSEGSREGGGGDYRSQRPTWKQPTYHGGNRDRDSDDRRSRDSRRYAGRDYRDDNRESRESSSRDGWSRGGDRRESHSRFHSPPNRWSSSSSPATGARFGSQSDAQRANPSYDSAQKPWMQGQHQAAQQPQQPQHKATPHGVSPGSWTSSQSQQPFNQQQQQQQQQWYQWQQYYTDPRARPAGQQNPETWKGHNPNQWVSATAPRPGMPDSSLANAQKPYQSPQNQPNQQQQNQWAYWQQWQQRSTGSQQTAVGASSVNQFDTAQQYQQHLAQWKQQCARYYEQNQPQTHPSQHK